MKLYFSPGACSLGPHIALMEAGFKFEAKRVDLKTKEIAGGGDFYKINLKGYVPTLELDNGEIISEGAVILQYIADQKPEKNLIPKFGTFERYRAQEWLNYIATEVHKGFSPLWHPKFSEETKKIASEALFKKFDFLDNRFKNNSYLLGEQFSVADAYLFNVVSWTNFLKMDISQFKNLSAFMKRISERPAVREAMIAEGLIK